MVQMVENLPAMQETQVRSLGLEDVVEKEMAIHSSILGWKIPWTEEPAQLQSMGSQRVNVTERLSSSSSSSKWLEVFWFSFLVRFGTPSPMFILEHSMVEPCYSESILPLHCWWECKLFPPWRGVWRCLKKTKIDLPYDPLIPLLGIYPEKNMIRKEKCTPMLTAALFTIGRT